jgi:HAMP domain-containing protein
MFRRVSQFFKDLALAQKLTILLLLIFFGGIVFSGVALSNILNYKAQAEITAKASLLVQTLNSVRSYTSKEVTPLLNADLQYRGFVPQVVPFYSSRRVFETLRDNNPLYKDFLYKEAMLNPTNTTHFADSFEKGIVQNFRQNKNLKEVSGFRALGGEKYFYIARPLALKEASCLRCHSTPNVAPKEMVQIYGDKHGFGWKLNEINGAQMIAVPTHEVLQKARQSFFVVMGIVTVIFALAIYVANLWLKRYVVRPIKRVVRVAEAVSTGDMEADFGRVSNDEVGSLVEAFTRMKLSLVMAIRSLEQYRFGNNEPRDRF